LGQKPQFQVYPKPYWVPNSRIWKPSAKSLLKRVQNITSLVRKPQQLEFTATQDNPQGRGPKSEKGNEETPMMRRG